jgi:hypothetical protein
MQTFGTNELRSLIGQSAACAYKTILLSHPIERVEIFNYQSPPKLQQRVELTEEEHALIGEALKLRASSRIPFWDALFSVSLNSGVFTDSLLSAAFFHNGQGSMTVHDREAVESGILERITVGNQQNVALGSKVVLLANREAHVGLLDFHCDISDTNTKIVHKICRELMPDGFLILDSGDSYHACASSLQSPNERIAMLGKALLVSPIVDAQYVAHQLQQGSSSIRMSRGGKAKKFPTVVDAWSR